jgi:hypothetical protein
MQSAQTRGAQCCGAGVSPAVFPIPAQRKTAGETPALPKSSLPRALDELRFPGALGISREF